MEVFLEAIRPLAEAVGLPPIMLPSALAAILILRVLCASIVGFGYLWVYVVGTLASSALAFSFRSQAEHPVAAGLAMLALVLVGQLLVKQLAGSVPMLAFLADNGMVGAPKGAPAPAGEAPPPGKE